MLSFVNALAWMPVPGSYSTSVKGGCLVPSSYPESRIFFHAGRGRTKVIDARLSKRKFDSQPTSRTRSACPRTTTMSQSTSPWYSRPDLLIQNGIKILFKRYRALKPLGKAFIWATIIFYIALTTFFIVVTPARIFQWLYDLAHNLSKLPFGWVALGGIIRTCADTLVSRAYRLTSLQLWHLARRSLVIPPLSPSVGLRME